MCLVCAGLWTGRTWRNNRHGFQESWTEAEEERFFDSPVRVRAYGEGIEGRPIAGAGGPARSRSDRQAAKQYLRSPWMATTSSVAEDDMTKDVYHDEDEEGEEDAVLVHNRQSRTTLALLQTFHAQTRFWLSRLATLLPPQYTATTTGRELRTNEVGGGAEERREVVVVQLTPRDVLELGLSPLSSLDACFVEWLAEEYVAGAGAGMRVSVAVRRSWRDLVGLVFPVGSGASVSLSSSSSSLQ